MMQFPENVVIFRKPNNQHPRHYINRVSMSCESGKISEGEEARMTGTKKCAHPACSCIAPDKQKYCSQICQDSKNVTALACHCDHPGCRT